MKPILSFVALAIAGSVPLASASPIEVGAFTIDVTLIDFDALSGGNCNGCGEPVTDQFSLFGVEFDNPMYPGQATAQTNLTYGVPDATGNIVWVFQGGGISDPIADPFRMVFAPTVNRVGFNFASSADAYLLLTAYSGNQLLDNYVFIGGPTATGWGGFAGVQSAVPITRLDVSYHLFADPERTLNFAFDNLRFEAIPEPSSLALGLLGLAGIAVRLRTS